MNASPIEVLILAASADATLRHELATHLTSLERQNLIRTWHEGLISPGSNRDSLLQERIAQAHVILPLVSSDFVASDDCYERQMKAAMLREAAGTACLIPVIARAFDWNGLDFARLPVLPDNAKAVSSWANRDDAWENVAIGIRKAIQCYTERVNKGSDSDALGAVARPLLLSRTVDVGLLDHRETLDQQIKIMVMTGARIALAMGVFNKRTHDLNVRIAAMSEEDLARMSNKARKRLTNDFARAMVRMADALKADLPAFSTSIEEGFGAMSGITYLLHGLAVASKVLEENAAVLVGYRDALEEAAVSIGQYRATFSLLPNITRELNDARKDATSALDQLIAKLSHGRQLTEDTLAATNALLRRAT